jgi:hypothetical protein
VTAPRLDGLLVKGSVARQLTSLMAARIDDWTVDGTTAQQLDGLPLIGSTVGKRLGSVIVLVALVLPIDFPLGDL